MDNYTSIYELIMTYIYHPFIYNYERLVAINKNENFVKIVGAKKTLRSDPDLSYSKYRSPRLNFWLSVRITFQNNVIKW